MKAFRYFLLLASVLGSLCANPTQAAPIQATEPAIHVGAPPPAPDVPHWQAFTSDEGRFSVLLPSAPDAKTRVPPNKKITIKEFICRVDGVVYVAAYFDAPPAYVHALPSEKILSLADSAFLGVEHVSLISERHLALDRYPGHETVAARSGNMEIQRTYLVGNCLYTLAAVQFSKRLKFEPANAAKFFNSFVLVPPKQAGIKH